MSETLIQFLNRIKLEDELIDLVDGKLREARHVWWDAVLTHSKNGLFADTCCKMCGVVSIDRDGNLTEEAKAPCPGIRIVKLFK
jgi:hypothetical protein